MGIGNFSKDPDEAVREAVERGYTGVRIEQGVPLLDRDLNLLGGLPLAQMRRFIAPFFGDAVDSDSGFWVGLEGGEPVIGSGNAVVDGILVNNPNILLYSTQPGAQPIRKPPAGQEDLLYLDVSEEEVDHTHDSELGNPTDVGMRTSVRVKASWQVRVLQDWRGVMPTAPAGHHYMKLASLTGPPDPGIRDLRPRIAGAAAAEGGSFPALSPDSTGVTTSPAQLSPWIRRVLFIGGLHVPGAPHVSSPLIGIAWRTRTSFKQFGLETVQHAGTGNRPIFRVTGGPISDPTPSLGRLVLATYAVVIALQEWDESGALTIRMSAPAPAGSGIPQALIRYVGIP